MTTMNAESSKCTEVDNNMEEKQIEDSMHKGHENLMDQNSVESKLKIKHDEGMHVLGTFFFL